MALFNWLLYLDVSDDLMRHGSEAHFRSAVSRAYYGVFGEIRVVLEGQGVRLPKDRIHTSVGQWLLSRPVRPVAQIGLDLGRLRRERNRADYDPTGGFNRARAEKALLIARHIESNIQAIVGRSLES